MLITSLLPLLTRYSLGLDLVAGPDGTVTLIVIPRKAEGSSKADEGEVRPIQITATAAEIDAELAKGADGALGQLIVARKALGDQLAEQRQAVEQAKTASAAKQKPATKAAATAAPAQTPPQASAAISEPKPGEPASLW